MPRNSDEPNIRFSQDNVLRYRRTRNVFPVEETDWERLVGMLNSYSKTSVVWWAVFSFFISSSLELIINYLILDQNNPFKTILLTMFAIAITATILTLIFAIVQKNTENTKKSDI